MHAWPTVKRCYRALAVAERRPTLTPALTPLSSVSARRGTTVNSFSLRKSPLWSTKRWCRVLGVLISLVHLGVLKPRVWFDNVLVDVVSQLLNMANSLAIRDHGARRVHIFKTPWLLNMRRRHA